MAEFNGIDVTTDQIGTELLVAGTKAKVTCLNGSVHKILIEKKDLTQKERSNVANMKKGNVYRLVDVSGNVPPLFPVFHIKLKAIQSSASMKLEFRDVVSESFPYQC